MFRPKAGADYEIYFSDNAKIVVDEIKVIDGKSTVVDAVKLARTSECPYPSPPLPQ
ncbi:hypothetical protein ANDO1_4159 [plant metagenome]|uniref:Uncharacterized protein n=1 Tax=plant metagenome TaxID=1297885 RepID=A0A484P4I7_9ZZZZ